MEQFLLETALAVLAWVITTSWRDMRPFRVLLRLYGLALFRAGLVLMYGSMAISMLREHWKWFASINQWPTLHELEIGMLIGSCLLAAPVYLIVILMLVDRVKTETDKEPK